MNAMLRSMLLTKRAPAIIDLKPSAQKRTRMAAHAGPASGRVRGGYIDDLAALGKAIALCFAKCANKFNASGYGYGTSRRIPICRGRCDGCGEMSGRNRLYLPKNRIF